MPKRNKASKGEINKEQKEKLNARLTFAVLLFRTSVPCYLIFQGRRLFFTCVIIS